METTPVLQMLGVTKRFPGVVALAGVDLDVFPGEVVALAGENGAGKSTLMKVLGGIYQPDEGELRINGNAAFISSVADAVSAGIGFVHQELNVFDNLSIAENIFLGREPRFARVLIDREKINRDAKEYMSKLGLDSKPTSLVADLSIAQKQLVEIAKALSQRARILIMDEPTSSLTLTETHRLLSTILELRAEGVSIIYISHRLAEIGEIADRVIVLRDGKNAGNLDKDEINHDNIVRLMVGRDIVRSPRQKNSSTAEPSVEIDGLSSTRYPNAVNSFEVRRGEILGFAGLVGSGRSEVAEELFGINGLVGASIKLGNKPVRITKVRDAIDNGIYLIPEDRRGAGLIVESSIRENISLPSLGRFSSAGLVNKQSETASVKKICEKLHVKTPHTETPAMNLSGGNQQKVVLAKWLSLEPKLLIFDEPTRGIDVGAKSEIYQLMRDLAAEGVSIIMISSDMEEVLNESDRIAVMHEGSITGILDRDEATEEKIMRLAVGNQN